MPQNEVNQFDNIDNNNTDISGTTVVQGQMYPYMVDNAFRKLMGALARTIGDATIAAAATTNLGSLPGASIVVTGNTTITSFGTIKAGTIKFVKFTGTPTLTYNATSLILPGSASITTAAGDTAVFVSEGSGNWRCMGYQRSNGTPLSGGGGNSNATQNLSFIASVASNALTIAVKGIDGNDPSASNQVYVPFRSVTANSGDVDVLTLTSSTSLVVSSGSTLGTTNATAANLIVVGFNDAGTFRLGIINPRSGMQVFDGLASSTAEGGAGGADTAGTFYTGTAVTSKAYTVLGHITISEATAGVWATAPTTVQVGTDAGTSGLIVANALPVFVCRAFLNYNGITATIRSSGNIASVTKNGTGDYSITFITPMPDADYTIAPQAWGGSGTFISAVSGFEQTATGFRVKVSSASGGNMLSTSFNDTAQLHLQVLK